MSQYVCTQISGSDCVTWVESPGLSAADLDTLLPVVVLVLVVAFALRLIRRMLFH
jgi:hypothetical protein